MAKCAACGKELAADAQRFCDAECRGVFTKRLKHGTRSAEIQAFVQRRHGFIPKIGWIAHVKEVHGIPTLRGADRARRDRDVEPCPPEKREAIEEALRHFGMM
jgi:hypothetical protein